MSVILYNLKIMFIYLKLDARFLLLLSFLLKTVRFIVITGITTSSHRYFYFWIFTLFFFRDSTYTYLVSLAFFIDSTSIHLAHSLLALHG